MSYRKKNLREREINVTGKDKHMHQLFLFYNIVVFKYIRIISYRSYNSNVKLTTVVFFFEPRPSLDLTYLLALLLFIPLRSPAMYV